MNEERNKRNKRTTEKLLKQYPLFTKDLPTFEDWIPCRIGELYFGSIEKSLYYENLSKTGNLKRIQEINFEHKKLLCSKMSYGEELELWLEKYPKYYNEFNMFIKESMNYYNNGM